jgi:aspartate ammonia-lyase
MKTHLISAPPGSASRVESDLLGDIAVPGDALFGAQTQRAIQNFPTLGQWTLEDFPILIRSLLLIKKAAALTNLEAGFLPESTAGAIVRSADQLLVDGWEGCFPIHYLHGGGGTSANMNANEVLANLAEELLGGTRGEYYLVHPNDHVNLNQSTNDVYPTACHMAVISQWSLLQPSLQRLPSALQQKAQQFSSQLRLARTCFQDAVEVTFQDYFGGMGHQISRMEKRLESAVSRLYSVNLGGTICGRPQDVPPAYFEGILENLKIVAGDPKYSRSPDLFDAAQNPDDLVGVSCAMDLLARSLIKIAKDLRVLSSGPQGGLGEIHLPPVQPGSSIMPGKVNPVIPEFVVQVCFRIMGNHAMCAAGLDHGELDLNVWESSMVFPILESMALLQQALDSFVEKCLLDLEPEIEVNLAHASSLIPRITRLVKIHGYRRVNLVCKQAAGNTDLLNTLLDDEFGHDLP